MIVLKGQVVGCHAWWPLGPMILITCSKTSHERERVNLSLSGSFPAFQDWTGIENRWMGLCICHCLCVCASSIYIYPPQGAAQSHYLRVVSAELSQELYLACVFLWPDALLVLTHSAGVVDGGMILPCVSWLCRKHCLSVFFPASWISILT